MAKRRLTKKQSRQIQKNLQARSRRATQGDDSTDTTSRGDKLGPERTGLVISHLGGQVVIEDTVIEDTSQGAAEQGLSAEQARQYPAHIRANVSSVVTGDHVVWREGHDHTGVIEAILPRRSLLERPNVRGQLKPIAANIDYVVIVFPVEPIPSLMLMDRYLVATELSGIEAIILLNKYDLLNDQNKASIDHFITMYRMLGYTVIKSSTLQRHGLDTIKKRLAHHNSVLVGQSGVGKSSLINALLPEAQLTVGGISEASGQGRHTTTNARLLHFSEGGAIIDSPGIREYGLWHIDRDRLIEGFKELKPLSGACRFRNCTHQQEPGCAIKLAVETGEIQPSRFENYQAILKTISESC